MVTGFFLQLHHDENRHFDFDLDHFTSAWQIVPGFEALALSSSWPRQFSGHIPFVPARPRRQSKKYHCSEAVKTHQNTIRVPSHWSALRCQCGPRYQHPTFAARWCHPVHKDHASAMKASCLLMVSRSTTRPKQPSAPPYPNPTAALRRGLQSGAAQRPFNGPSLISWQEAYKSNKKWWI